MSILSALNQTFTSITSDSRAVQAGGLFLAYPGEKTDGRQYISAAIHAGAKAVIWESLDTEKRAGTAMFSWESAWNVQNIAIENLKQKVGEIAAEFYQNPSEKCVILGVTGTNGKTSVSQWLGQCLMWLGKKTAVIGTIGNGFVNAQQATNNTTPDAILLQKLLADYVAQDAQAVAMEVSSHGLSQGRVNGVKFDVAIFTNLSRDHLDYHQTMAAYGAAKRQLFDWPALRMAVINADDAFGAEMVRDFQQTQKPYLSYGLQAASAHVRGANLTLNENGLTMHVTTPKGVGVLEASVLGEFNAYNLLAVLATLISVDFSLAQALAAIKTIQPVAGRMQKVGGGAQPLVVVDYAHTPDALEKVLTTLRMQLNMQTQCGKLYCVFGCGGDRDAGKRSLMGQVAVNNADVVIVTSDNPRNEDPSKIIQDITQGLTLSVKIELDRKAAISHAISEAMAGDIVLIAGKGHEDYQEIAGVKTPFSDVSIAQLALKTPLKISAMQLQNNSEVSQ